MLMQLGPLGVCIKTDEPEKIHTGANRAGSSRCGTQCKT